MTLTAVTCTTLEFNDDQANSHKFYRVYTCGSWTVFQWGRVGAVGQWSGSEHSSSASAKVAANDQLHAKKSKGYALVGVALFDHDESKLSVDKDDLTPLDAGRRRAQASSAQPAPATPAPKPRKPAGAPDPDPAPPVSDVLNPHAVFAARALTAITLAVTDPQKAVEEFAILNDSWKDLEIQHAKAASYLKTLDQLLIGATT